MPKLRLRRIEPSNRDWDDMIKQYRGRTVFHESSWHAHLMDIHPSGRMVYYEVLEGATRVGLHCGLQVRKMGLAIHGSPLGGTGTNFMAPLVDVEIDRSRIPALLASLLRPFGALHLEVAHWHLEPSAFTQVGFEMHEDVTHLVPLPLREEDAWNGLKSSCRNRIRKAQQNGLVVRAAQDESVAARFFEQFVEVYGKQGMRTPFGPERALSLYRRLAPANRLLAIEVEQDGRTLATGLFPYDDQCIYFWGAASWLREQHLYPNEVLHWEVIKFAVSNRIAAYNMCGGQSQFKDKFGGADVPYRTYSKSLLPGLSVARSLYRKWHYASLRSSTKIDASTIRSQAKSAELNSSE